MTQFFLVRHAQASFGASDYDKLSELGHRQARWLGEYYRARSMTFDALITGAMVRHAETAQDILGGLGVQIAADVQADLNEIDAHGIVRAYLVAHPDEVPLDGAPPATFYRLLKKAMTEWRAGALAAPLPESWAGFRDRVTNVMNYVRDRYAGRDRVLIISSGGAIAMWMHHVLRTADETVADLNLQIRNSSVSEGFFNRNVYRLSTFNQVPHLDRTDRLSAITYS